MADLIPYRVHDGAPEEIAELVWATSADEAATLALVRGDLDVEESIVAERIDVVEGYDPPSVPGVEHRDEVLRAYGWAYEGDERCECCGLAEMAGAYPVCPACDRCPECGHADDRTERDDEDYDDEDYDDEDYDDEDYDDEDYDDEDYDDEDDEDDEADGDHG